MADQMEFTTTELLEAQAHVWNLLFSFLKSMCLKSAVELGIADALKRHKKPINLSELMAALSIPPSKTDPFRRLMRTLVQMELFSERGNESGDHHEVKYLLTPCSHLLVPGETMNVLPFASLVVDPNIIDPSHILGPWFKSPKGTPFEFYFSKGFWEVVDEKPEFNKGFNEGMASDSELVGDVVMMTCRDVFKGLKSLVDVGGGTGIMARAIAHAFPETKCTVLDLPHVINTVNDDNSLVEYIGGDMFVSVPHANAALLKVQDLNTIKFFFFFLRKIFQQSGIYKY